MVCHACRQKVPKGNFCANCGVLLPRPRVPTEVGKRRQEYHDKRWEELMEHAPASSDQGAHVEQAFLRYLKEEGAPQDLFQATPRDVIGFLMSSDETGRTKVHATSCVYWGQASLPAGATCACPVRAAAKSLDTRRGILRAVFRDKGRPGVWSPMTGTGNPCAAPEVDLFLTMALREQKEAGVKPKQAALIDESAFRALQEAVLIAWDRHMGVGAYKLAAEAARDALLFALAWTSGLRSAEVLRVCKAHVAEFRGPTPTPASSVEGGRGPQSAGRGGWYVNVGVTKGRDKKARRITIRDDGTPCSPVWVWTCYVEALGRLGLDVGGGELFRALVPMEDGSVVFGDRLEYAAVAARMEAWLKVAGFPVEARITLHSFHGSRAARERAAGVPKEQTCKDMGDWDPDMYEHYTGGREPLTVAAVRLAERPSGRWAWAGPGAAEAELGSAPVAVAKRKGRAKAARAGRKPEGTDAGTQGQ